MATNYKTPGVYVEEISVFPPSVAQVETAIPAFIGYTENVDQYGTDDLKLKPIRITSLKEYESLFGMAKAENIEIDLAETKDASDVIIARSVTISKLDPVKYLMYYQLQMYFANGGGPCYIISIGKYTSTVSDTELKKGLDVLEEVDEPTLIVFPEGVNITGADKYYALQNASLSQCGKLQDRFSIIDCHADNYTTVRATSGIGLNNLKYGAVYHPYLKTILLPHFTDATVTIKNHKVTDSSNVETDGALKGSMLNAVNQGTGPLYMHIKQLLSTELEKNNLVLPPCGAIAGIYALVDSTRGVWKAPANVSLNMVKAPSKNITNDTQGIMNIDVDAGKSINAIRSFIGKGIIVWGARTLAGNDNEWRYVSVRRFFNMVEESVKKASGQFVFEPNDANTWVKVKAMIENFLTLQWRAGALAGAKPEDAFFVKVGLGQTMTAQDVLEGKMIIEIGMAAVRPAEFIILKFSHLMQQS